MLHRCVTSAVAEFSSSDIWVIDNNSTDNSVQKTITDFPNIHCIRLEKNFGFAEGYNRGLIEILPKYSFVLLLNNDTIIQPSFGDSLRRAIASLAPEEGMIALKMVKYPAQVIDNFGLVLHPSGLGFNAKDATLPIVCPSGGAAVYRTRVLQESIERTGEIFDADFKFYNEDLDLGLRVRIAGWRCAQYTDIAVLHAHGASMTKQGNTFGLYYQQRNQLWCILKNYSNRWLLVYGWQVIALQLAQIFYHVVRGHGLTILRAKWDSLIGIRRMLRKRRWRQSVPNRQEVLLAPSWSLVRLWRA